MDKQPTSRNSFNLIDPNDFVGQSNTNNAYNIFVPLEDLNISVELTTTSKPRSLLTLTTEGNTEKVNSDGAVKISFIEGSEVNGQKYLTTKYTDLKDVSSSGDIEETLGITNIDIDFNSAYAPQVTINFIDVRGGAIFQNAATSKYSVLFKMPYPIFKLKIKGYYGKPVSYCLHLTKVNSKFNAQTGNFEITANFVGYTYAMLTDMLVGYLKAIPETTQGKAAFAPLAAEGIIPLSDLIRKIGDIDAIANKLSSDPKNKTVKDLSATLELKEKLSKIEGDVVTLKNNLDTSNLLPNDNSIIVKLNVPQTQTSLFQDNQQFLGQETSNVDVKSINDYKVKIETDIDAYNAIATSDLTLDKKNFLNVIQYLDVTRKDLSDRTLEIQDKVRSTNGLSVSDAQEVDKIIDKLNNKLVSTDTLNETHLDIYDLTSPFTIIKDMTKQIYDFEILLRKELAYALRDLIKAKLGFDPSIRNMFKIIAKHIEVFLQILYDVSARYKNNKDRDAQLDKFKCTKRLDVKCDHDIYPWPEYNNEYNKEQYLGAEGVVAKPLDIPEVAFVEEFYRALIVEAKKEKEAEDTLLNGGIKNIWYSVNPLDTTVFNTNLASPYKRVPTPALPEKIAAVVLMRAVTFLAVSNRKLNSAEIEAMATAEAARLCEDLNGEVKNNLIAFKTGWDKNKIKNVVVKVDKNTEFPILKKSGENWEYIFRSQSSEKKFIPIDKGFNIFATDGVSGTTFLTNYNAAINTGLTKPVDSGMYIKVFSNSEYVNATGVVSEPVLAKDVKIIFENLKGDLDNKPTNGAFKAVGFNPFGTTHGSQEYRLMDWGSAELNNLELRYVFYANDRPKTNGLCGARKKTTKYDIDKNTGEILEFYEFYGNYTHVQFDDLMYDSNIHPSLGKNRNMAAKTDLSKVAYPLINFSMKNNGENLHFSLFGSRFYYAQSIKGRAMLFLHSFPWNGVCTDGVNNSSGVFTRTEIINLFAYRAGFVQVPKLWPAFIGGLLWRYEEGLKSGDPIKFKNGTDQYLPLCDTDTVYPKISEYLASNSEFAPIALHSGDGTNNYRQLDAVLLNLPQQVKNEFKKAFDSFVNSEWDNIRSTLELLSPTGTATEWVIKCATTLGEATYHDTPTDDVKKFYIPTNNLYNRFTNIDNYIMFAPMAGPFKNNILLELKEGAPAMNSMISMFNESAWVANTQWNIWGYVTNDATMAPYYNVNERSINATSQYSKILVSDSDLDLYLNKLTNSVNAVLDSPKSNINKKVFGINENDEIKLNIYRTLKAIYDKWIAGTDNPEEILFQCGNKLPGDALLAEHRTGISGTIPTLIDSFRFVTRSFQDIGDDFLINPQILNKLLVGKSNQSVYSLFSDILKENNFDFVALPSFINYNNPDELKSVFKPYSYSESTNLATSGPSFVCVYVGQVSTKLDFGDQGDNVVYAHPNDGVDITKDGVLPSDFQDTRQPWEEAGAAFMVNYGHQNQNIFKDISLDQNEFTETSEGLQIMDDISNMATGSQKSYVGQNLYNVWSVRSYKAQVEMLGNAMIQPMMYFQLNNVPMFHGAYLITSVKHNIRPNHMTTNFTGTRIKYNATPLIDAAAMYTSLLADYKPPVLSTNSKISDDRRIAQVNGTNAKYIGYVTRQVTENDGLVYQVKNAGGDNFAIKEVGDFMELLAVRWHNEAKSKPYTDKLYVNNFGRYRGGSHSSHGENSKHGVGLAVDLRPMAKDKSVGLVRTDSLTRYDRNANIDFIRFAINLIKTDGNGLVFDNIILNDDTLVGQFTDKKANGDKIVITQAGHTDHIHFEFDIPNRIVKRVEQGYLSEDNIITTVPEGSAVKLVQARPVGAEINKYLGQI